MDLAVKKILDGAAVHAHEIVTQKRDALERLAKTLLQKEVIEGAELQSLLKGEGTPSSGHPKSESPSPAMSTVGSELQ